MAATADHMAHRQSFRGLAANIMQSLHRGDPAIVTGLLNTEQWRDEQGVDHSRLVLEASNVGFDLNYVVTMSMRTPREGTPDSRLPHRWHLTSRVPHASTDPAGYVGSSSINPVTLLYGTGR